MPPPTRRCAHAFRAIRMLYSTDPVIIRVLTLAVVSANTSGASDPTKTPSSSSEKLYGSQSPTLPTPPNALSTPVESS